MISPKYLLDSVMRRGYKFYQYEKFVQELAWREYFQNVWQAAGDELDTDLKQPQEDVKNSLMPQAVSGAGDGHRSG